MWGTLAGHEMAQTVIHQHVPPIWTEIGPKLFNILADLLSWILEQKGVSLLMHYLDDFLTLGPSEYPTCLHNLETIKGVCHHLGVPLALEKVEAPSQSLTFLGIILDTRNMKACLPHEKLQWIRDHLATWLVKHKATKRQILSRPRWLWQVLPSVPHWYLSRQPDKSQSFESNYKTVRDWPISHGSKYLPGSYW